MSGLEETTKKGLESLERGESNEQTIWKDVFGQLIDAEDRKRTSGIACETLLREQKRQQVHTS